MMLQVERLSKSYGRGKHKKEVLRKISLNVADGELVGIVGESGSGKSTLARIIMQLEHCDEGEILFHGKRPVDLYSYYSNCQIVFQHASSALNPSWTVMEILREPLRSMKGTDRDAYIFKMLDKVQLSKSHISRRPSELSGGERQRVNVLRSILVQPKLLICDEIVSNLDRLIQKEIVDMIRQLNEDTGMAILFISHDLRVVNYLCDRVYVMKSGQIVDESKKQEGKFSFTDQYAKKLFA